MPIGCIALSLCKYAEEEKSDCDGWLRNSLKEASLGRTEL
jgi:hypothetical protein